MISIRPEQESDTEAIRGVHLLAFGQKHEADLVDAIRDSDDFDPQLSLVAEVDRQLIGHILYSPLIIKSEAGEHRALALAPIAVRPDFQNQGIGSALVRYGNQAAANLNHRIVIVVGDPEYYSRFGFSPARPLGLACSLPVPDENFMVLELVPGALSNVKGSVAYPPVFGLA
ncbi:MAG: N-acetyltransferase [Candidatus Eisenbacteria bacterium]|uniref:N-acetyltransferase n=1 Tax=Eiseniibacteriota bacterium TaxID=2212470 RepID=A0A948S1Q2_UNCEI|nr:N-acetyltransferase [Candidatus Eisenbacteria bacterium]MBU1948331.1 N-acetyltransferase [Candidatus Eisenbacteria bacterium]MBU2692224.1 N-acetyltransferase [Candidatus Eisenbacteria bacterium]